MSKDVDVWDLTNKEMERQRKNYQQWIENDNE
jgi:cell division FtsZ-interacting protein ZapD